ncbi:MAG TPA: hypothetical protein VIV11_32380 [Kofleriaceae bacterium]
MRLATATGLAIAALVVHAGCTAFDSPFAEDAEDGFVVEDGKADDFFSLQAKEYVVTGTGRIVAEEGATDARVRKLIALEHTAITWFLNAYLVDKEREGAHADANANYGGFSAMVKNGAYETLRIVQRNATTWDFTFEQVIAGDRNLMRRLPLNASSEFTIEVGTPTNAEMERDAEWYRKAPWDGWNPSAVPASQKESLTLAIREEVKSSDAWWDYKRLFEDGALTVDVHYGYDYHSQSHLSDSKRFYAWLIDKGFRSPVASYDKYTRTSGALTKTLDADGRSVRVEVRLFYGRPGTSTDPDTDAGGKQLERDMFASLKSRDVIVYAGHSGPLYGFALANWDKTEEGDVDDSELAVAELAPGRYQIVFAEGCNTYMLGSTLMKNPAKQGKDIDVITTTSFSVSYSPVEDFLGRLLELDSQGRHRPRTMTQTLEDLDLYSADEESHSMYGVHGIDDDPKLHPYANPENLCRTCSSNTACGGVGNACVSVGTSGKRCVAACTSDTGCPGGYQCKKVASASTSTIYGSYCVPATRSCQ